MISGESIRLQMCREHKPERSRFRDFRRISVVILAAKRRDLRCILGCLSLGLAISKRTTKKEQNELAVVIARFGMVVVGEKMDGKRGGCGDRWAMHRTRY